MHNRMFGELFQHLRKQCGYTLREYCRTFGKDAGYMSKIERGVLAPPTSGNELRSWAMSLGLKEDTEAWEMFFTTAAISAGRIPDSVMTDEEVLPHLPILLRTMTGEKLTEEKLRALIEVIKKT